MNHRHNVHMDDFLSKYDSIVVFGNYRYGSTVLCDLVHNCMESQGVESIELNEYLHSNKYLAQTEEHGLVSRSLIVDRIPFGKAHISFIEGQPPKHLVRSKLEHWQQLRRSRFVIFKISPDDFHNGNDDLIYQYVINDPRVYKLGLNRAAINHAIVSYAISIYHNVWNENAAKLQELWQTEVQPVEVSARFLQDYVNLIMQHNTWLYFNSDKLRDIAWFEDLSDLRLPDLGFNGFSSTKIAKHPIDHVTRARKYFTNADDLLSAADLLQTQLKPLIDNVRRVTKASLL
jgi:hypothetical protein